MMWDKLKHKKTLITSSIVMAAIIIGFILYKGVLVPRRELQSYNLIKHEKNPEYRITKINRFLNKYPRSDYKPEISQLAFRTLSADIKDTARCFDFFSTELLRISRHESSEYLYSNLRTLSGNSTNLSGHNGPDNFLNDIDLSSLRLYQIITAYRKSRLSGRFDRIHEFGKKLVAFGETNPAVFSRIADSLSSDYNQKAYPVANNFYQQANRLNTEANLGKVLDTKNRTIIKNKIRKNYFHNYFSMAQNACKSGDFLSGMNYISQASKFDNLNTPSQQVCLGILQYQTGEKETGWLRLKSGLILSDQTTISPIVRQRVIEVIKDEMDKENPEHIFNQLTEKR